MHASAIPDRTSHMSRLKHQFRGLHYNDRIRGRTHALSTIENGQSSINRRYAHLKCAHTDWLIMNFIIK